MAEGHVISPLVNEALKLLFEEIRSYVSLTWKYEGNTDRLKVEKKNIEERLKTVQSDVNEARNNAENIRPDVENWLSNCEELIRELNESVVAKGNSQIQLSCLCCALPNLRYRYSLSKKADRMTNKIIKCLGDGEQLLGNNHVGQPKQPGPLPPLKPGEFHEFDSRKSILKEAMLSLEDDSTFGVGICGMGGCGKTFLVKKIQDQVQKEKLFDEVAFAVVSQDPKVREIQRQLALHLGLKDMEKKAEVDERATLLYKRLMQGEQNDKTILIILDDMWDQLDLHTVGIPSRGERKGLKILLTSRLDTVSSHMEVQTLEVNVLSKQESWDLFRSVAKVSDASIMDIAKEVAHECGGLPLGIVTIGKALMGEQEYAFQDLLLQLRDASKNNTSGIPDVLYKSIKVSYDHLRNDEDRSLLLLCSTFPEDTNIFNEDLVSFFVASLEIFESMEVTRVKVRAIVDRLKHSHLLLVGDEEGSVKLHDVVRDVCLWVDRYYNGRIHMLRHGDLNDWPQNFESHNSIWLEIVCLDKFPIGLQCPKLQVLTLFFKKYHKHLNFSKDVFQGMQELLSLDITNAATNSLSSSLQFLINLRKLSIDRCMLDDNLPGIGRLQKLRVLSFFHSGIKMFPKEIAQLTNLKSLDLRFDKDCSPPLPSGILSSLKNLEELYLGYYFLKDVEIEEHCKSIKEVNALSKLYSVQYACNEVVCLVTLLENLNLQQLKRFQICTRKSMHTQMLKNYLELQNYDMMSLLVARGLFVRLEKLHIENATNLEEYFQNNFPTRSFERLKELTLARFDDAMVSLWSPFQTSLISNIRKIHIQYCDEVRSLFLKSAIKFLGELKEIRVIACLKFERLVTSQDEIESSQPIVFPQLKYLNLKYLTSFTSTGLEADQGDDPNQSDKLPGQGFFPKLEILKLREAEIEDLSVGFGSSLPSLRSMKVVSCHCLSIVANSKFIEQIQNIKDIKVERCKSVSVIFDFEGINGEKSSVLLDVLETLSLSHLPKLKHIWKMPQIETQTNVSCVTPRPQQTNSSKSSILHCLTSFLHKKSHTTTTLTHIIPAALPSVTIQIHAFQNLTSLYVEGCSNLRYVLTPNICNMLVSLEKLHLVDNNLMESVIGCEENDSGTGGEEISLPKLISLKIESLEKLTTLCSCPNHNLELPALTDLRIFDCPKMSKICDGELSARKLGSVGYSTYRHDKRNIHLDIFTSIWLKGCESNTVCLNCRYEGSEACDHFQEHTSTSEQEGDDDDDEEEEYEEEEKEEEEEGEEKEAEE